MLPPFFLASERMAVPPVVAGASEDGVTPPPGPWPARAHDCVRAHSRRAAWRRRSGPDVCAQRCCGCLDRAVEINSNMRGEGVRPDLWITASIASIHNPFSVGRRCYISNLL